jgi:MinD-like ATPase involved in chromosome partitioning or flagellar assembly
VPFVSDVPVFRASELIVASQILDSSDRITLKEINGGTLSFLERGVVGGDWTRVSDTPSNSRITLYGFKGGVGRSTATFMLARHLAEAGLCVLVADLDFESPGVGTLVQDADQLPDYGLADYMVESALSNENGLDLICRSSRIESKNNGEVWLAPAAGRPRLGYSYLPKLNRIYSDVTPLGDEAGTLTFASRLKRAIEACELEVRERSRPPEVVLLDSRAGIHDVAAVAISQLSDLTLLFGTNSEATWSGYRALFSQWGKNPSLASKIRERLRMVASMVPAHARETYLASFRDRAQACFAETLYDDMASTDVNAFNPSADDESAPHSPLSILFSSDLVGIDASDTPDWHSSEFVQAAFSQFVKGAASLIQNVED